MTQLTAVIDWVTQQLTGAPIYLQLPIVLVVILPILGLLAGVVNVAVDWVANRFSRTSG